MTTLPQSQADILALIGGSLGGLDGGTALLKASCNVSSSHFRFPWVRPVLPSSERIAAFLEAARAVGQFSNFGPNNLALETSIEAQYMPGAGVSATTSCTVGLSAALLAFDVAGPVLVPAFTFPATHDAIRGAGLQPITIDVDPKTGVISETAVETALARGGVGAVMAVRPYGIWSDLLPIEKACRNHGVPLVIDNASGFGVRLDTTAQYRCLNAVEVFSLHATKPAAVGEGGIIVYPQFLHREMRAALNFGMSPGTPEKLGRGLNGKMDEVRASVARAMLIDLPGRVAQRQAMAAVLGQLAIESGIEPFVPPGEEWRLPWQCFPLMLPQGVQAAVVVQKCAAVGLQVRRYYHPLVGASGNPRDFPCALALSQRMMCLPIYDGAESLPATEMWNVFIHVLNGLRAT